MSAVHPQDFAQVRAQAHPSIKASTMSTLYHADFDIQPAPLRGRPMHEKLCEARFRWEPIHGWRIRRGNYVPYVSIKGLGSQTLAGSEKRVP